jgi:hypothetical protein
MQSIASENPLNDVRGYEPERRPSETLSVGILARLIVWEGIRIADRKQNACYRHFLERGFPTAAYDTK